MKTLTLNNLKQLSIFLSSNCTIKTRLFVGQLQRELVESQAA